MLTLKFCLISTRSVRLNFCHSQSGGVSTLSFGANRTGSNAMTLSVAISSPQGTYDCQNPSFNFCLSHHSKRNTLMLMFLSCGGWKDFTRFNWYELPKHLNSTVVKRPVASRQQRRIGDQLMWGRLSSVDEAAGGHKTEPSCGQSTVSSRRSLVTLLSSAPRGLEITTAIRGSRFVLGLVQSSLRGRCWLIQLSNNAAFCDFRGNRDGSFD
jgi:hypothetical protein